MLLAIEMTLNVFALAGIVIVSLAAGYMIRASRLAKLKNSYERLENEMLSNHAEILRLQKELADKTNTSSRTPIVPMREPGETSPEKLTDNSSRKKLLGGS